MHVESSAFVSARFTTPVSHIPEISLCAQEIGCSFLLRAQKRRKGILTDVARRGSYAPALDEGDRL